MKPFMMWVIAVLLVAISVPSLSAPISLYSHDVSVQNNLWQSYKSRFGKQYNNTSEESYRQTVYLANLQRADNLNAAAANYGGHAAWGETKFSDLTLEEFQAQYTGFKPTVTTTLVQKSIDLTRSVAAKTNARELVTINKDHNHFNIRTKLYKTEDVNPSIAVDWSVSTNGSPVYTTPIKDQGQCGSCWAFSAVETIESDTIRLLSKTYLLSPQQLVDCDSSMAGCNGGDAGWAIYYVHTAGGIEAVSDYSYVAQTRSCSFSSTKVKITVDQLIAITGWSYGQFDQEAAMAAYLQEIGPLGISVCANDLQLYSGGVMTSCTSSPINHQVQLVGISYPGTNGGYWKGRNQWGTGWGESGYFRFAYGQGLCGITTYAGYTVTPRLVDKTAPTYAPTKRSTLHPAITGYPTKQPFPNVLGTNSGGVYCTDNYGNTATGYYVDLMNQACIICPVGFFCPDGAIGYPCSASTTQGTSTCNIVINPTMIPTVTPTAEPSISCNPSASPTTSLPTASTSLPSVVPTNAPTFVPTTRPTASPSVEPTTSAPTKAPSKAPSPKPSSLSATPTVRSSLAPSVPTANLPSVPHYQQGNHPTYRPT